MVDNSRRSFLKAAGIATVCGGALSAGGTVTGETDHVESGWSTLYHDSRNTGANPDGVSLTSPPVKNWSRRIHGIEGAPAVVDGVAYVAGTVDTEDDAGIAAAISVEDGTEFWRTRFETPPATLAAPAVCGDTVSVRGYGTIHQLSRSDGAVRWSLSTDGLIAGAPVVADGTLYFATTETLYAVDPSTGRERWQFDDGVPLDIRYSGFTRVAVDSDTAYLGSNRDLYALSKADGSVRWQQSHQTEGWPTVLEDSILVTGTAEVVARDKSDGSIRWETGVEGNDVQLVTCSPAVVDDTLIVSSRSQTGNIVGVVTAIDPEDGSVEWRMEFDGAAPSAAAGAGSIVYVVVGNRLLAVDADDGSELWAIPTGQSLGESIPVVTSDAIYHIDTDGYLHSYSTDNSALAWRYEADVSETPHTPLPSAAGSVVTATERGSVHAIDVDSGEEQWSHDSDVGSVDSVAGSDGGVFVAGDDALVALDAASGTEQWSFTDGPFSAVSPTGSDDTLYAARQGPDSSILAVDANSGEARWKVDAPTCEGSDALEGPLAVTESSIYVSVGIRLWALDRRDGSKRWTTGNPGLRSFAVSDGSSTGPGSVYYGDSQTADSANPLVYALDAADGTERWSVGFEDVSEIPALTAASDTVYAIGVERVDTYHSREHLFALAASDGTLRWQFELDQFHDEPVQSPAVDPTVDDGTAFAAGDGRVYAIDATDGTEIGRFETAGPIRTAPAVDDDGVSVGSGDGYLYRFQRSALTE